MSEAQSKLPLFREFAMLRLVSNLIANGNSRDQDEVTWMKGTLEWDS